MTTPLTDRSSTLFLSPQDVAAMVRRVGVAKVLGGLADAIAQDFLRWPQFDKSARLASHSRDGVIELMPIADAHRYSFKYVNGHPKNTELGLSTVMAFGVLADVATGLPLLISELTLTTALRTAATSVLAARALARPGSRVMALIGNGAQSEFQALAFHHLMGIEEIRLYDIDPRATAKLVRNLGTNPDCAGLRLVVCGSTRAAVQGADIVTTVTADKTQATIICADMLEPGMHINGVGGDCPGKTELAREILERDDVRVVVEYAPQSRIEGEIQQMPADFPVTEFADVLASGRTARQSATEITLFDSVGFALEDFSALRFLHQCLQARAAAPREIDLVPRLDDPKDLFGGTLGNAAARAPARLRRVA